MSRAERRRQFSSYAALAAGSAVVLAAAPAQYLGRQQDDLLYIALSQSLARGSYRLDTVVGRPFVPAVTPGWPLVLLPVSLLAPDRIGAYVALAALLQAAVPWAVFAWAKRRVDETTAVLIALLCAASPLLLSQAGAVMSETPYLLASLALLAAAEKSRERTVGGWLAALAWLRPAAASLIPASLMRLRREPRKLLRCAAIPAAAVAGWAVVSRAAAALSPVNPGKLSYHTRSWAAPLSLDLGDKALFYARAWGGQLLPRGEAVGWLGPALGALLLVCAAAGAFKALRARVDDPPALALAGTAAMQAVWAWQYERYLIPLLPLLWWGCALAWGRAAKPLLAAALAFEVLLGAAPWLSGTSWREVELPRTYAWLSHELPEGAAVASAAYLRDGFYAGRPSLPLPDTESAAEFAARLRAQRVEWALWQDDLDVGVGSGGFLRRRLDRAAEHLRDKSLFSVAHEENDERTRVYRLK